MWLPMGGGGGIWWADGNRKDHPPLPTILLSVGIGFHQQA